MAKKTTLEVFYLKLLTHYKHIKIPHETQNTTILQKNTLQKIITQKNTKNPVINIIQKIKYAPYIKHIYPKNHQNLKTHAKKTNGKKPKTKTQKEKQYAMNATYTM